MVVLRLLTNYLLSLFSFFELLLYAIRSKVYNYQSNGCTNNQIIKSRNFNQTPTFMYRGIDDWLVSDIKRKINKVRSNPLRWPHQSWSKLIQFAVRVDSQVDLSFPGSSLYITRHTMLFTKFVGELACLIALIDHNSLFFALLDIDIHKKDG